jgi:hypothetical protein
MTSEISKALEQSKQISERVEHAAIEELRKGSSRMIGIATHPAAAEAPLLYEPAMGLPRSPKWPEFRQMCIQAQPWCSACGRTTCLEVHHIAPVHLHLDLELDEGNVIVLCENAVLPCHYTFGHRAKSWSDFDAACVDLVTLVRKHLDFSGNGRTRVWPKPEGIKT